MRTRTIIWALVVVTVLVPAAARGDIGPPVSVQLLGEPRAAKVGERFEGVLEITSHAPGQLSDIRLAGKDWSSVAMDTPASLFLDKGQKRQVRFSTIPTDPDEPLGLELFFEGRRAYWTFDLSERNYLRTLQPGATQASADDGSAPGPDPVRPGAYLVGPPPSDLGPTTPDGPGKSTIRVRGRFTFIRDTTRELGAHGVGVAIVDARNVTGEVQTILGSGVTDGLGYYDIMCSFTPTPEEAWPDIQAIFSTYNQRVFLPIIPWNGWVHTWSSQIVPDYTGSDLDLGTRHPLDELSFEILNVFNDVNHAHYQFLSELGYDTPPIVVWYPNSDWPHYEPWNDAIFIPAAWAWDEGTHCHEWGHHWMHKFSYSPAPEYCNAGGYYDDNPPDDCGHGSWCAENANIAWIEGVPYFISDMVTNRFTELYGAAALNPSLFWGVGECPLGGGFHDPLITEGFFAAVLRDIYDDDGFADCHTNYGPWCDQLVMGADEIFRVANEIGPGSPQQFLEIFLDEYPEVRYDLWETAKNCGYELDTANPGVVTNLISTSHQLFVPSADPTIDFTWTVADDDASGVGGYSVLISPLPTTMPPAIVNLAAVTQYTTGVLGSGTHYISIRAQDRAGNWSDDYAWWGPLEIQAAAGADLEIVTPLGWPRAVVPRPTPDAAPLSCPDPVILYGNSYETYWNIGGRNGGWGTTGNFIVGVEVDGSHNGSTTRTDIAGGTSFAILNHDVIQAIKGGRHTFGGGLDIGENIYETDEMNNVWAHQWVWTPLYLSANTPVVRIRPPQREGGWGSVVDGSPLWYNCDGLRFLSSSHWNAFVVRPLDAVTDFDCRLHPPASGTTSGFADNIGYSTSPAGYLDVLLVNQRTAGTQFWDVGVINDHEFRGTDYEAEHVTNLALMSGDSITVHFDQDEMLKLWQFFVGTPSPKPLTFSVWSDLATPVWALYLDETYTTGCPTNGNDGSATTLNDGSGRINIPAAAFGYHCVVVYRNPVDGTGPIDVTIELQDTAPNLEPFFPPNWYRPLVPRPAFDSTPALVEMPDTLHGGMAATYLNLAVRNQSPTASPYVLAHMNVDGVHDWSFSWSFFSPYGESLWNWNTPRTIPGGRHTLSVHMDALDQVEETDETDNDFGDQYCWSPLPLNPYVSVTRPAPPNPMGGWDDVLSVDHPLWFNCDGLRLPAVEGYWRAVAVMPGAASDVDVRLHETLVGAKNGFLNPLASSGWGLGESDYVLVNFNRTPLREMDAGVLLLAGSQDYTAEAVGAPYVPFDGNEVFGPYTLEAGRILDLGEILIDTGLLRIHLENLAGTVDWGLTVHRSDQPYLAKSDALPDGASWLAGPGEDEVVLVDIPAQTFYCIAIWKRDAASLPLAGTYQLRIDGGVSGVVPEVPQPIRTRLASVFPNPFNPQTAIAYELLGPTRVRLEIFDLLGKKVRVLVDEVRPAGRHEALFDARDDAGRALASGIYVARLVAGDVRDMRKVVLLK